MNAILCSIGFHRMGLMRSYRLPASLTTVWVVRCGYCGKPKP